MVWVGIPGMRTLQESRNPAFQCLGCMDVPMRPASIPSVRGN